MRTWPVSLALKQPDTIQFWVPRGGSAIAVYRDEYFGPPLSGPLAVHVRFYDPRPRSHFDGNTLRRPMPNRPIDSGCAAARWVKIADELRGALCKPSQIVSVAIYRYYADNHAAGAEIKVVRVDDWEESDVRIDAKDGVTGPGMDLVRALGEA